MPQRVNLIVHRWWLYYQLGIRTLALYSMGDESSDMLESGPIREKARNLDFFLFSPPTCSEIAPQTSYVALLRLVLLQVKNMLKIPKFNQIHEFSIFIFFFPPT